MDASLAVCIAIPLLLGSLAGYATRGETMGQWYTSLQKPSWMPPRFVFGPVWTVLYILMGIAAWRVVKAGGGQHPLALYGLQLGLNVAWSFMFFSAKNLKWALLDIIALLGVLVGTTFVFYRVDRVAGYLMIPYVLWVAFATLLTLNLYLTNPAPK